MAHGLDDVETEHAAAPPGGAADRVLAMIDDVVVIVSSVALVAASFVLTYSVIVRYFLKFSTDWQDEMSVFLIVGGCSCRRQRCRRFAVTWRSRHRRFLPSRVNMIRLILVDLGSLTFCAFFAWKSWTLLHEAVDEGFHSGSTWGPPLWIPYSLMAVGMTLLSIQILLQVIHGVRHRSGIG